MTDTKSDILEAYWVEQSKHTLVMGRLFSAITVVCIIGFMFQDVLVFGIGWFTALRLIGLVPAIAFLIKAYTTFRRDVSRVIPYHTTVLACTFVQICAITFALWHAGPDLAGYEYGTTQGITAVALVAFLLAGGARRYVPLFLSIPFSALMILLLSVSGRQIQELALFTNPAIVVAVVASYSKRREKTLFSEFSMRRLAEERQAELARASELLAQSNAELQGFVHAASHDLKQPLNSVSGFIEIIDSDLRERGLLDKDLAQEFAYVTEGAVRMRNLIDSLLAYSRGSAHRPVFADVDLNDVLATAESDLSAAITESDATIRSGPLGSIQGDAGQLACVLENLIGNAIKYAREGVPPVISIDASEEDGVVRVTVTDNGIGFDEKYASEVFDAFRRLHTSGRYEGTGLGLALCHKHIRAHGGDMGATSTPGEGSRFWFTLPREPAT